MKKKILVTAATGNIGLPTVKELLKLGFEVKALVRNSKGTRALELKRMGAEVVAGDMNDVGDMRKALKGIQRAFFCAPFQRNTLMKTVAFVTAAEEAKLEHVVYMSQWLTVENHHSDNTKQHWLSDEVIKMHRTVKYTFINTGIFGFMYFFTNEMVAQFGMLPVPIKGAATSQVGLNAPPSEEDQGRVVANILKNPSKHIGRTYRITGPKLISFRDIAKIFAKVLGRKVKVNEVSKNMFFKSMLASGSFPKYDLLNVQYYMDELGQNTFAIGESVTNVVKELTGREPEDFETITRRVFENSPEVKQSFTNKLKALKNMVKMMLTKTLNTDQEELVQGFPRFMSGMKYSQQNPEWLKNHQNQTNTI